MTFMTSAARLAVAASLLSSLPALAQDASVSFRGQTVTMTIGFPAGGGTDATGRLVAQFLTKHLPGSPDVVVRNVPGADGMTALNHFAQQTKPDGLTVTVGSGTQVDPSNFRKPQAQYDPATFHYVGGVGRGGTVLLIASQAEPRLYDRSSQPVVMGAIGNTPRSGMQVAAWGIAYLGWNARWVVGYRGTNDLILALERGEIDMTSTGNMFQIEKLVGSGKFKILTQSGTLEDGSVGARPDLLHVPVFPDQMKGKIDDPLAQKAFDYWRSINSVDKWIALPAGTPAPIVAAYRDAYRRIGQDPEFLVLGRKISEDIAWMSAADMEALVRTIAATPDEALDYMRVLLDKQRVGTNSGH